MTPTKRPTPEICTAPAPDRLGTNPPYGRFQSASEESRGRLALPQGARKLAPPVAKKHGGAYFLAPARQLNARDGREMQQGKQDHHNAYEHQRRRRNQPWIEACPWATLGDCGIGKEGKAQHKGD